MSQGSETEKRKATALYLTEDHNRFVPFSFQCMFGEGYIEPPFARILNDTIDRVISGEITRLIINIAPRMGKTLSTVHALVSRIYAINPRSNIIHTSYSQSLVHTNSVAIRDIVNSGLYQRYFPDVQFRQDMSARGLWKTTAGGTFLGAASGSGIVGHGAGILGEKGVNGMVLVDDPSKPDDIFSPAVMSHVNSRWETTLRSRLANQWTPVIVIMQRISENDFTGHLLEGEGASEGWHHLVLPTSIDPDYEYKQTGNYIPHDLPAGSIWPDRIDTKKADELCEQSIQHSQSPAPTKGEVYEREWFRRYSGLPAHIKRWAIYCDTASKTNKYNDYSVFQLWAVTVENDGYLVDQWRDKVKIPFLIGELKKFYEKAQQASGGADIQISIEDKDSGTGLIQGMELEVDDRGRNFLLTAIQRKEGKYARAVKAAPQIKDGRIYIPDGRMGDGVITEATKFKADDSHKNDDQIDPMNDFINFELPAIGYDLMGML